MHAYKETNSFPMKSNPDLSVLSGERGNLGVGLNLVALTPVRATLLYKVS